MQYLGAEYQLSQLRSLDYRIGRGIAAKLRTNRSADSALRLVSRDEDPALAKQIILFGKNVQKAYGEGGSYYQTAFTIGWAGLRRLHQVAEVPAVGAQDWGQLMDREAELRDRPDIATLEGLSGIGLLEVRTVNPGYVDGYEEVMSSPVVTPYLGYTALGTLHAHDLMHFASQRKT